MDKQNRNKKEKYDKHVYAQLTQDLIKTVEEIPHLKPSRDDWDIEGDWSKAGTIHFLDAKYQASFERFSEFDCRSIKLVNLNKPAVKITFYLVHKYWIIKSKDLAAEEMETRVTEYINKLLITIENIQKKPATTVGRNKIASARRELQQWSLVHNNLDAYEVAVSNYHRDHVYTNINFKYATAEMEYGNSQVHLLTSQRDSLGNISQLRHNVVFVDTEQIMRNHPYQNKTIELYLKRFTIKSSFNRDHLYAKIKSDYQSVKSFELNVPPELDIDGYLPTFQENV